MIQSKKYNFIKSQMEPKYLNLSNGQKIHYRIENEGSANQEALVFIHGNFSALGWWNETIDALKSLNRKMVAFDLRGFGKSSYLNKCTRFADWARDVVEAVHLLKLSNIVLIGWSFGGAISQKVCELDPQLVSKLILTCSVCHEGLAITNDEGKICKTEEQITKIPKFAGGIMVLNSNNHQAMRGIFDLLLFKKLQHLSQERKAQLALDPFNQRCYPQLLTALANSDINIDAIKTPTLALHGTEDLVLPIQTMFGTAAKLGKLDAWESYAHMIPLENTERYVETIKKFIEGK